MKKLLIIFIFYFISHSAFANKIQGSFICEDKSSDGEVNKFTLTINGSAMTIRIKISRIKISTTGVKYKEIFFADHLDISYTIFASQPSYRVLYIVSPTKDEDRISFSYVNPVNSTDKHIIGKGMCDRN